MAAPIKTCEFCSRVIKDKSYRSLTSESSREQYGATFLKIGITPVFGKICNQCANKLNRLNKLNADIQTKVSMLEQERDKLLETVRELPGVVIKMSTPRKKEKRLIKHTPTPKSRLKKCLFLTPTRTPGSAKIGTSKTKVDKSTQTDKRTTDIYDVKITVKYSTKERSKNLNADPEKSVIKAMLNNKKPLTIMKHYSKSKKYMEAMLDVVKKEILKEINILVKRNGDVLQSKSADNLLNFDWNAVSNEFQVKAPYLHSIFCCAANLNSSNKKKVPCLMTSVAILLYTRSQRLNQLQHIIGLIADKCGLSKEGLKILHDLGIVVSSTTINKKKKQLVKQQEKRIAETVTRYIKEREEIMIDAKSSEVDVTDVLSNVSGIVSHAAGVVSDAPAAVSDIDDTSTLFPTADIEVDPEDKRDNNMHYEQSNIPDAKPIEILGDNFDITINPAKMTIDKQRKSLHWFLTMVKQKRVTAANNLNLLSLSEDKKNILEVPTCSWLPSMEQMDCLHENIVFHVSHILLKYIEFLKPAKPSFPSYIPHQYMEKTKEKSVFLNCDLIEASENSSQGMITILQRIHNLAVPHVQGEIPERIVFGGDVLTNERAYSAQEAMQNDSSPFARLNGLIHRPEGLHREMNFLLGIYRLFYKESTSTDIGTLYQLRNLINRRDVSGPEEVINKFRPHHQFIDDVTDGYIVAAFLDIMDMDDISSVPLHAPVFSLMDDKAKIDWVLSVSTKVIESLGFCNFQTINEMHENLQALHHDDSQMEAMKNGDTFECALCDKKYTKVSWFKKHLEKNHLWKFHSVKEGDAHLNPVQCFLIMSLLLRDTCDAYKMGDGDRIVRNAHMEWLYASAIRHYKYKLWLWRMISYVIAILDPRDSFEYKWNMTVNLQGGIQNNIPNDNCVEIQVHNIKSQLNTQGANKSFESAKLICMTTQVIDGIKEQLMKTTKTIKSRSTRPSVDKAKDIITIVQKLRKHGLVKDLKWESLSNFKEPLHSIDNIQLHDWINAQKKVASIYM